MPLAEEAMTEGSAHASATTTSWETRFAGQAIWSLLGSVISYGGNFVVLLIAARILGTERFGHFGMVTGTIGAFGVFAGLGLSATAARHVARYKDDAPRRAAQTIVLVRNVTVLLGVAISFLLFVAAPRLAERQLHAASLSTSLKFGCALLLFSALLTKQAGILSGLEGLRQAAWTTGIRMIIAVPITFGACLSDGVRGAVVASSITAGVGCLINERAILRMCAARGISLHGTPDSVFRMELLRYAVPAFIGGALAVPAQWYAMTFIATLPRGYIQIGLLSAVNNWKALVTFVPVTLGTAALPMIAMRSRASDRVELAHAVTQLSLWPVTMVCLALARPILGAYGAGFVEGLPLFLLMLSGTALGFVGNALGTLILGEGLVWYGVLQNAVFSLLLVGIVAISHEHLGVLSVAVGNFVGYGVLLNWTALYLRRRGAISGSLQRRTLAGGAIMCGIGFSAWAIPMHSALVVIPAGLGGLSIGWLLSAESARQQLRFVAWQAYASMKRR
jgi:O-antigen/teichoic acid export membrane protein